MKYPTSLTEFHEYRLGIEAIRAAVYLANIGSNTVSCITVATNTVGTTPRESPLSPMAPRRMRRE
jgi:DNA-binding beta-propeller fold protein YncE